MWGLDYKETWAPKSWYFWTVVLEKTLEGPLDCKEIQPVHSKGDQSWILIQRTAAEAETPILWPTWCEELTHWKRPWCWERLTAGGEGDDRGWDGWMSSPTGWTWVWVSSWSWWWTGKPGVLQSTGSQRVRHDWATELNWAGYLRVELLGQIINSVFNMGKNCQPVLSKELYHFTLPRIHESFSSSTFVIACGFSL